MDYSVEYRQLSILHQAEQRLTDGTSVPLHSPVTASASFPTNSSQNEFTGQVSGP